MAPGRLEVDDTSTLPSPPSKPTVYLLDSLHPTAVKHAQSLFHAILPRTLSTQNGAKKPNTWSSKALT
jgi:hypothetical protein